MVLTKTIKLDDETLQLLSDLKVWYAKQDHKGEITFDLVINELMLEHTLNTNPEIQQKKKDELLEGYVTREVYNNLEAKSIVWMKKYLALERENNAKKAEIDDREKEVKWQLKKQQDIHNKLQSDLIDKEKKISLLNIRIGELLQKLDDIKDDLVQWLPYDDSLSRFKHLIDKYFKSP